MTYMNAWSLFLQAMKNQNLMEIVDEEAMSQIRKGHDTMCVVLTSRHKNLDTVRAVWSTGDIKASHLFEFLSHCKGLDGCFSVVLPLQAFVQKGQ